MKKESTITREKIAQHLCNELGFSVAICSDIVKQTFAEILDLTQKDQKTMLQNFGTWKINEKAARPGFNIHTKEEVSIEPRTVLRFLPAKTLKIQINSHDD
ncbi:MAG: HU family DNA-binding protein [Rickettsiaceae bacterium]